jgi:hypothetical protein
VASVYTGGAASGRARLRYRVEANGPGAPLRLTRRGAAPRRARDTGQLLYLLDSDLSVQLQRFRRDLYFLHAAVLVRDGRAALLVGASGSGKSTAAWALTHHGFRYAGDELAPLDVERLSVHPCPRALCLKAEPPGPYGLPREASRTSRGWHVPLARLPRAPRKATALSAIFFVGHRGHTREARLPRPLSPAEAAARLYAHALNPLAHAGEGLDPAIRVAAAVPAFRLDSRRLSELPRRVGAVLDRAGHIQ